MIYRRYGKTNLEISVLTFGAMRIPFNEDECTAKDRARGEANTVAAARRAMELGINHIDTARGYGNSERLIGLALKELGRDKFYITTKISAAATRDEAGRYIDEALKRLDTDKIDIMDLHGINTLEKLKKGTGPNGCLRAVQDAIEEGKVSFAGFSSHAGPDVIVPALDTGMFSTVSMLYWWTHQRNAVSAVRAAELDIGVLILSPAEKGGLLFKPTPGLSGVCKPFTPLVLCHRWLLAQKGVTTVTVGAANPGEFDAHINAGAGPEKLTADESAALQRWLDAEHEALGNTRCTLCCECMPCPQHVAIPEILRLRNLAITFDMVEFGKMRYNLLSGGANDWFPGEKADKCNNCDECLPRCPEKLKITELLAETQKLLTDKPRKRLWR